jgi:hypothetical protein
MNNINEHIVFLGKNVFPFELRNMILKRILFDGKKCEPKYRHGSEHGDTSTHTDTPHEEHYDVHTDHNDHNDSND